MILKILQLCIPLLTLAELCLGQSKFDCSQILVGRFKQTLVQPLDNYEVSRGIIYPINQSTAKVEIRLYEYMQVSNYGRIFVLSCKKGVVEFKSYDFIYSNKLTHWPDHELVGADVIGKENIGKNNQRNNVFRSIHHYKEQTDWAPVFKELKDAHLFTLPTEEEVYEAQKVKFNLHNYHHGASVVCEIKFNQKYRNIEYHGTDNLLLSQTKEFHMFDRINKLFFSLYGKVN
jgi:hypothetical protein